MNVLGIFHAYENLYHYLYSNGSNYYITFNISYLSMVVVRNMGCVMVETLS